MRIGEVDETTDHNGRGFDRPLVLQPISRRNQGERVGGGQSYAYLRPISAFCISLISIRIVRPSRTPLVNDTGGLG